MAFCIVDGVAGRVKHSTKNLVECFEFFLDANARVERFGELRGNDGASAVVVMWPIT